MPCNHKFIEDLNLENLDFAPTTLIVGTFNPAWPEGNKAEWFYGRIDNNFWDVLPRLYGKESMRCSKPSEWKQFCKENKVAITDLIETIADANEENNNHIALLKTFSDKNIANEFSKQKLVDIVELLKRNPTIKNIYFTRGIRETFWKRSWKPIKAYCDSKKYKCETLLTPSGYAFYQQAKYNKKNMENSLNLEDFILKEWKTKWHF